MPHLGICRLWATASTTETQPNKIVPAHKWSTQSMCTLMRQSWLRKRIWKLTLYPWPHKGVCFIFPPNSFISVKKFFLCEAFSHSLVWKHKIKSFPKQSNYIVQATAMSLPFYSWTGISFYPRSSKWSLSSLMTFTMIVLTSFLKCHFA